jgi:hypothetical protein
MQVKRPGTRAMRLPGLVLLALGLGACGVPSAKTSSTPRLSVHIAESSRFAALPVDLSQALGFFRQQGIRLQQTSAHRASLTVGPIGGRWPVVGIVNRGLDGFVLGAVKDPGFRLTALNQVPVAYPKNDPALALAFRALMRIHHVTDFLLEPLTPTHMLRLWQSGHLPYVVANAALRYHLLRSDPQGVTLVVLSATTGPMPSLVVSGRSHVLPQFLAGLNLALWYLETHTPQQVWSILPPRLRTAQSLSFIEEADRHHWFSPTTVPSHRDYDRARAFWQNVGVHWPTYYRAVDMQPSLIALSLTP